MFHPRRFHSLKYKILSFSTLVMVPLIMLGVLSYARSSRIVRNKFAASNLNTVKLVGDTIDFMLRDVSDISLFVIQNDSVRELLRMDPGAVTADLVQHLGQIERSILMSLVISKPFIHSIAIRGYNGVVFNPEGTMTELPFATVDTARRRLGGAVWQGRSIPDDRGDAMGVISLIRVVNDLEYIPRQLGTLEINIDERAVHSIYKDKLISPEAHLTMVTPLGQVLSSTDRSALSHSLDPALLSQLQTMGRAEGYFETTIEGEPVLVTFSELATTKWLVLNAVPVRVIVAETLAIRNFMLAIVALAFLVSFATAFGFSSRIIAPLKDVRSLMNRIQAENFDVHIEPSGNDEITLLVQSFNLMSKRLGELVHNVYVARIRRREAELQALQAQVNPHFLYNTLDTIYWMSRMEKAFETSRIVEALSRLFRLSLNNGNEITTVGRELQHLRYYTLIQKIRYQGRITFAFNVDESLMNYKTIKLALQPLVENAINHGIEKNAGTGTVRVDISHREESLIFQVRDDGIGIDAEEVRQLMQAAGSNSNRGFAVRNLEERIRLAFTGLDGVNEISKYGLDFQRLPGRGSLVEVRQPLVLESISETTIGPREPAVRPFASDGFTP